MHEKYIKSSCYKINKTQKNYMFALETDTL